MRVKDIDTTDHGFPKWHPFGKKGEHSHLFKDNDGELERLDGFEISEKDRKENRDII